MKSLLFSLVAALLLSACSYTPHEVAPTTNQPTKSTISTLAQQPYALRAFGDLQHKYPATAGQRQAAQPGWAPTPWGLADTTHVLTLQQTGGRPFYTFNLQAEPGSNTRQKLLLYPYEQGSKGLLLHYEPHATWNGRAPFQGTLTIKDLEEQVINVIHMAGGVATPVAAKQGTANRGIFTGSLEAESCLTDVNLIEVCNGGEESTATGIALPEELQECYQTIELVYETCNANTVGAPGISTGSMPGTPLPAGGGSGSNGPGTTTPLPPEEPTEPILTGEVLDLNDLALDLWVEEQIFDSLLDECIKEVLGDLRKMDSGIVDLLQFFEAPMSVTNYNVEFASVNTSSDETVANTYVVEDQGIYSIKVDVNRELLVNASDLAVATVLLHEIIHAYLTVKLGYFYNDIEKTYPALVAEFYSTRDWNGATHNEMTKSFVNELGASLGRYGKQKGYILPDSFYKALAWGGLEKTDAYNSLTESEKANINLTLETEFNYDGKTEFAEQQKGTAINCQ